MSQLPSLFDIFAGVTDPRNAHRVEHPLPDVLTIAVCGILVGADTFEEIELWAQEKEPWLRRYLSLPNGIPAHDTFARLFGLMDPQPFEAAFRRWVAEVLPGLSPQVVALDGKTSRRSAKACEAPLHLVTFAARCLSSLLEPQADAGRGPRRADQHANDAPW